MWALLFLRQQNPRPGIDGQGRRALTQTRDLSVCSCWPTVPLLLLCASCEGTTTTDTVPWSCNEPNPECPMTPEPAGLAGFWRFDGSDLGGQARGAELSWFECNGQGGEWVAGGATGVCGSERLGGMGGSLRLSANGYVEAPLTDELAQGPLTLAAWVSLYRSATQRMSVVSVARPGCQSAWLDLSTDAWQHILILSVEKPIPDSDQCEVDEVHAKL